MYFVYGNWDNRLGYFALDTAQLHQVHLNVFDLGGVFLTGFSGCPTAWGENPEARALMKETEEAFQPLLTPSGRLKSGVSAAEAERFNAARAQAKKDALALNRAKLAGILQENPERAGRTIVLTHEKLTRLEELGHPLLHVHGHLHTPKHSLYKGSHILNAACVDAGTTPFLKAAPMKRDNHCGYTVIEIENARGLSFRRKTLESLPI